LTIDRNLIPRQFGAEISRLTITSFTPQSQRGLYYEPQVEDKIVACEGKSFSAGSDHGVWSYKSFIRNANAPKSAMVALMEKSLDATENSCFVFQPSGGG